MIMYFFGGYVDTDLVVFELGILKAWAQAKPKWLSVTRLETFWGRVLLRPAKPLFHPCLPSPHVFKQAFYWRYNFGLESI
jgi:hypothetical protein